MQRVLILLAVLLGVTVLVLWVSGGSFGGVFATTQSTAQFTFNVTLLILLLASLVLGWQGSFSQALRYAFFWVALGLALVLAYSFREDASALWQRVAGELNPAQPIARKTGAEIAVRRADDGHFYVDTDVNGSSIRMLADTGATAIALSAEDAERAGIDVEQLDFMLSIATANGQTSAAEVMLDEVRVGNIVRRDVRALVSRGLGSSLLGMSFFNTLSKVAIESDELVLRD